MDATMNDIKLSDGDVLVLSVPAVQFWDIINSGDASPLERLKNQIRRDVIEPTGCTHVGLVILPDDMQLTLLPVQR